MATSSPNRSAMSTPRSTSALMARWPDSGARVTSDPLPVVLLGGDSGHLKGGRKSGLDLLRYIQENASHRVVAYAFTGETSLLQTENASVVRARKVP